MTLNTSMPLVHVCYCANGGENVAELIENRPQHRMVLFYDSLDVGPLKDLHFTDAYSPRLVYFRKIHSYFSATEPFPDEAFDPEVLGVKVLFPPPAKSQAALVWTGQTTNEQMMLRAVCAHWPDTELWQADVCLLRPWHPGKFPTVSSFTPDALSCLESMARPLSPSDKLQLANEWHELILQDHVLRIYQDEKIVGVPEDFFDAFLLESCTKEWQFQARVAGACQANSGYSAVGDVFLFYRLEVMAQHGRVEFQRGQYEDCRLDKIRRL